MKRGSARPTTAVAPPVSAAPPGKDTLIRRLALAKLRELRASGLSYHEIGRRYGAARGAGERRGSGFEYRLSPERLLSAHVQPGTRAPPGASSDAQLFLRALDGLEPGLAFFDSDGRLRHANRALTRRFASPQGERLRREVLHFAETLRGLVGLRELEDEKVVEELDAREVPLDEERLRLRGSYIGLDLFGSGACVLVTLERTPADPLSLEALRARFGLSRQESRLAQLLVEGRSNAEIAGRLSISPHTARHHTEHVLRKLGVRSRAEAVARVLRG